jgi:hypothetical protein
MLIFLLTIDIPFHYETAKPDEHTLAAVPRGPYLFQQLVILFGVTADFAVAGVLRDFL